MAYGRMKRRPGIGYNGRTSAPGRIRRKRKQDYHWSDPGLMSVDCNEMPHHWECNGNQSRRGGGRNNRRVHYHAYSRSTQRHWGDNPGGHVNRARTGYYHRGHGQGMHFDAFGSPTQEHWGAHPHGNTVRTHGFRHVHSTTGGGGRRKSFRP